jgi:beta-glucanase (GH16 family)
MAKLTNCVLLVLVLLATGAGAQEWKLVWSDEFNVAGMPDPNKWDYEQGYIRNRELQYYTRARPENARVEDGCLVIETRKDDFEGHPITSASLTTRGRASWCYGRIEVRAKLPTGKGMWPAIWMLGTNRQLGWPACGEIDIMENVGFDPMKIHANIHTKTYNHVLGTNKGNTIDVADPSKNWHIYAIEWFEDHIDFFVDKIKYFTFGNEGTGNNEWPFDKPFYLILNAAYGGSWGGAQGTDDSILPQKYFIDYVRIYQSQ